MSLRIAASSGGLVHRAKLEKALLALYDNSHAADRTPADTSSAAPATAAWQASDIEDCFAENVTFRDPLMKVVGIQDYRAQFAALHALFPKITMKVYSISWGVGTGKLTQGADEPGTHGTSSAFGTAEELLVIDALCVYETSWASFPIRQVSSARVNREGRIVAHEDLWSLADLWEKIPLIGWLYRWWQPKMGTFVSKMILRRYAGKAGVAAGDASLGTNTIHAVYHPVVSARAATRSTDRNSKALDRNQAVNTDKDL